MMLTLSSPFFFSLVTITGFTSSGGHFANLVTCCYRNASGNLFSTQSSAYMQLTSCSLFSYCFSNMYRTQEFIDSIISSSSTSFKKKSRFRACVSNCKLSYSPSTYSCSSGNSSLAGVLIVADGITGKARYLPTRF